MYRITKQKCFFSRGSTIGVEEEWNGAPSIGLDALSIRDNELQKDNVQHITTQNSMHMYYGLNRAN